MEDGDEHIKTAQFRVNEHRKPVCVKHPEFPIEIVRIVKVDVTAVLNCRVSK